MVEQVPVSCLGLFQHQWVGLWAYGMDHQLGAASVQTVDHGSQALHVHLEPLVGLCFLKSNIVMWLFYIFSSLLTLTYDFSLIFFFFHLFQSFFVFCCLLIFFVVVVSLVNEWKEDWIGIKLMSVLISVNLCKEDWIGIKLMYVLISVLLSCIIL